MPILTFFKSLFQNDTPVEKDPYALKKDSGWFTVSELPDTFENGLFLVRFKNNPTYVATLKYNPETKIITNNWDEEVKLDKVLCWSIVSFDDPRWNTKNEPSHDYRTDDIEKNNFMVQIGDQYHHCNILNTGNRYGLALCYYKGENRVFKPKKWFTITEPFVN